METTRAAGEANSSSSRFAMPHPLSSQARVLLTSVFGPYAQDDEYGSRAINPMELYHNQVTRVEGPFSLRMFHRSWGLMLIQANIAAPCTLLDFPTRSGSSQKFAIADMTSWESAASRPTCLKSNACASWSDVTSQGP